MTLLTSFQAQMFSASLPDINISTEASRVAVAITFASEEIYNETLYPDTNDEIYIADIAKLVEPYAKKSLVGTLTIQMTDQTVTTDSDGNETATNGQTQTLTTELTYCAALISEDAATFLAAHFLTLLIGAKTTALGRIEYLHYVGTDAATVTAYYSDNSSQAFTAEKTGGNDNYSTIEVSPSLFTAEGKTLVSYTVNAGSRTQEFVIDFNAPDAAPVLLFNNSFGCQDIIYCTGTHTVAPEFTFSSAYIDSTMQNYDIKETRTFKADTGVLTFPMAQWLNDLFRSDTVQLLNFNNTEAQPGQYVVLTDVKAEYSNDHDALPRFTFSYRYAKRNQNILDLDRAGRIFDNTFDYTFN